MMRCKLIFLFLFFCSMFCLHAQNSMSFAYTDLSIDNTLIRTDPNTGNDIVYCRGTNLWSPCFFFDYKKHTVRINIKNSDSRPNQLSNSDPIDYDINCRTQY